MSSDARKAPPPAPPLPHPRRDIMSSSKPAIQMPSAYLDSRGSMPEDSLRCSTKETLIAQPYTPVYYLFYGTLTQPKILSHILDLKEQPALQPARITGYALTDWGQYRALVCGGPGQEVAGHAYLVRSAEDELKLARYETNAYEAVLCEVRFTDGRDAVLEHGMTFRYAGDDDALKAGMFDRRLWELRTGTRLPGRWRTCRVSPPGSGRAEEQLRLK